MCTSACTHCTRSLAYAARTHKVDATHAHILRAYCAPPRAHTHKRGTAKQRSAVHASSALMHNQVSLIIVGGYLPAVVVNEEWFSKQVAYCRWQTAQPYDLMFRGIRAQLRGRIDPPMPSVSLSPFAFAGKTSLSTVLHWFKCPSWRNAGRFIKRHEAGTSSDSLIDLSEYLLLA